MDDWAALVLPYTQFLLCSYIDSMHTKVTPMYSRTITFASVIELFVTPEEAPPRNLIHRLYEPLAGPIHGPFRVGRSIRHDDT